MKTGAAKRGRPFLLGIQSLGGGWTCLKVGRSGQAGSVGVSDRIAAELSRLAELLAQAIQGFLLSADAKQRTFIVGTLIQNLAAREYFPAQLLCRPGQEKLGLDEILLEKRYDCLVQFRDIVRAARAHHDAIGVRGA